MKRVDSGLDQRSGFEDSPVQTKSILAVSYVLMRPKKRMKLCQMQLRSQLDWSGRCPTGSCRPWSDPVLSFNLHFFPSRLTH